MNKAAKDAYSDKMQAKIDKAQAEIQRLQADLKEKNADARLALDGQLARLREQKDSLQTRVGELTTGGAVAWDAAKSGITNAWQELESGLADAREKLKQT